MEEEEDRGGNTDISSCSAESLTASRRVTETDRLLQAVVFAGGMTVRVIVTFEEKLSVYLQSSNGRLCLA